MAIWAIGDIQGCYDELARLLDKIRFEPSKDQLWLVGDLVNRGGQSLEVLRLLASLDQSVRAVLGNHDFHLLAHYVGHQRGRKNPEFERVFAAADGDELVRWLRFRPLMHTNKKRGYALVHAGIAPYWDLPTAKQCAREVEHLLRSPRYPALLANLYGDRPNRWKPSLTGWSRQRAIINNFTRMRFVDALGRLNFRDTGKPGTQAHKWQPWYQLEGLAHWNLTIVHGHWAALGYRAKAGIISLDTGCVWGGKLTAVQLR